MGLLYRSVVRPALFSLECEKAHHLALKIGALLSNIRGGSSLIRMFTAMPDERLKVEVAGIKFANPIGLAAGFDKDGSACLALAALGFGHIEIGTVTTDIQPGNDLPRLFRIPHRNALVNSLGFPSSGIKKVVSRLESVRASSRGLDATKLGVNIGKSKATLLDDAPKEYAELLRAVSSLADYVVVNVSSPNTPELRKLQEKSRLEAIFSSLSTEAPIPVFVKIAPDLSFSELDDVLEAVLAAGISGIVATNTTVDRSVCRDADSLPGGISGEPLHERAVSVLSYIFERTQGKIPLIGVGGIRSLTQVLNFFGAGASLVQLYTGLVYEGPFLIHQICKDLSRYLSEEGVRSVSDLRGEKSLRRLPNSLAVEELTITPS